MDTGEKILVVDDNTIVGKAIRDLLQHHGFEASYCHDGQTALALSQERCFHVIITDYQMPGLNGLDVTRSLRARYPESFIVGMSSDSKEDDFLGAGADAFLRKPFLFRELAAVIKNKSYTI